MLRRRVRWLWIVLGLTACGDPTTSLVLASVAPDEVQTELGATLFVVGQGFRPLITVDFDRPDASVLLDEFAVSLSDARGRVALPGAQRLDDHRLTVDVPRGVAPGLYDVVVVAPQGATATLVRGLTVSSCGSACSAQDGGRADAGSDGGAPDAGGVDAGGTDAGGTDAGGTDAGGTDAGGVDAGGTDAGGTDAGAPDAGPADAGPVDAGCMQFTYADDDGDGVGRADAGAVDCGPLRARLVDDCDDFDGRTFPDAGEVCNRLDDDCDGLVDEGVCPPAPGWQQVDAGAALDFRYVAGWSRDRAAVASSTTLLRESGGGFVAITQTCPSSIVGLGALDGGDLLFAGANGGSSHVYEVSAAATRCQQLVPAAGELTCFRLLGDHRATAGVDVEGRLYTWPRMGNVRRYASSELPGSQTIHALSGSSITQLDGVGVRINGVNVTPRAYRWRTDTTAWSDEQVHLLPGAPGVVLRDVASASATDAVAVGDRGTLFERRQGLWRLAVSAPDAGDFLGACGFGRARVYVVSSRGEVLRWNGRTLDVLDSLDGGPTLRAIHGSSEDALWIAGDRGFVAHWP